MDSGGLHCLVGCGVKIKECASVVKYHRCGDSGTKHCDHEQSYSRTRFTPSHHQDDRNKCAQEAAAEEYAVQNDEEVADRFHGTGGTSVVGNPNLSEKQKSQ